MSKIFISTLLLGVVIGGYTWAEEPPLPRKDVQKGFLSRNIRDNSWHFQNEFGGAEILIKFHGVAPPAMKTGPLYSEVKFDDEYTISEWKPSIYDPAAASVKRAKKFSERK